jgi:hypothetical protein
MSNDDEEKPPYFKYAFSNVYNLTMLGGFASAAVLTQNWWLGVAGAGAEVLWMLFAPDSRLLRNKWFDKRHKAELEAAENAKWQDKIRRLSRDHTSRVANLQGKRLKIVSLANDNQALTTKLLKTELEKLDKLMDSFLDLLISVERYESHLQTVNFDKLEKQLREQEKTIEKAEGDAREMAQKNLAILMKRREKLGEIMTFVARARTQLQLIENTFDLLTDQIVTMSSPEDMHSQLDDLMDGVEAVKSTAREAESLLQETRVAVAR